MQRLLLRINGRGNAWPIPIGQHHPFYDLPGAPDYANASFSLIATDEEKNVLSDILIDAGHGIVPFLLTHGNRIPDALVITHPHFDHILGMDWIIQSHYRFHGKKPYPVYATRGCREQILRTLPHLENLVKFTDLRYGIPVKVTEFPEMTVTAYPVYHGLHARGASMLLFSVQSLKKRIIFTGDLLFPMLRKKDLEKLHGADWLVADANNRFPYPKSNHWSVTRHKPEDEQFLGPWIKQLSPDQVMIPHQNLGYPEYEYLLEGFRDYPLDKRLLTVEELVTVTEPANLLLTHYSGTEDLRYYGQPLLDTREMHQWAVREFAESKTNLHVSHSGDLLPIDPEDE